MLNYNFHIETNAYGFQIKNKAYNKLSKHIKSFDVIGIDKEKNITSMCDAEEFYILMDEAKGTEYSKDITRILKNGITEQDKERTKALANYLVEIHSKKKEPSEIIEFCKLFNKLPKVVVPTTYPTFNEKEMPQLGIKIVIYANHILRSSIKAIHDTLN